MAALQLIGTAVTGLFLLVVALAIARGVDWRSNDIFAARENGGSLVGALAESPAVWVVTFLSLALGLTAVVLVAVGGFGLSAPGGVALAVAPFAALLLAYLVVGTYTAARDRNVSAAVATLAAALVVGVLLLAAIAGNLLLGI